MVVVPLVRINLSGSIPYFQFDGAGGVCKSTNPGNNTLFGNSKTFSVSVVICSFIDTILPSYIATDPGPSILFLAQNSLPALKIRS